MEDQIFQRTQFTFYESFYNSIEKTLKKKSEKLAAYEALIQYALYGAIEEKDNIPDSVSGLLEAFYPFLNTARRKAKRYRKTVESGEFAAEEQNKNKIDTKIENKTNTKTETKTNTEIASEPDADKKSRMIHKSFEWFWSEYPKQIGKEEAYKEFCKVTEPADKLVEAVRAQRASPQWQKESGRYIPNPASWLRNKRWTDRPPATQTHYPLGQHEIDAIRRIMANPTVAN